jgi:hypothetical protein
MKQTGGAFGPHTRKLGTTRVARWFIFKPKIPIWVDFGVPCIAGIFYGQLVNFLAICYILWHFGIFYGTLVYFVVIWYIFSVLI